MIFAAFRALAANAAQLRAALTPRTIAEAADEHWAQATRPRDGADRLADKEAAEEVSEPSAEQQFVEAWRRGISGDTPKPRPICVICFRPAGNCDCVDRLCGPAPTPTPEAQHVEAPAYQKTSERETEQSLIVAVEDLISQVDQISDLLDHDDFEGEGLLAVLTKAFERGVQWIAGYPPSNPSNESSCVDGEAATVVGPTMEESPAASVSADPDAAGLPGPPWVKFTGGKSQIGEPGYLPVMERLENLTALVEDIRNLLQHANGQIHAMGVITAERTINCIRHRAGLDPDPDSSAAPVSNGTPDAAAENGPALSDSAHPGGAGPPAFGYRCPELGDVCWYASSLGGACCQRIVAPK